MKHVKGLIHAGSCFTCRDAYFLGKIHHPNFISPLAKNAFLHARLRGSTFIYLFAVSHELQSKDVIDKTPKMKLKDNTVSSSTNTKHTAVKTTTATTSKTDSKWLATSNVSTTAASDKLKPLVTHELSVVS